VKCQGVRDLEQERSGLDWEVKNGDAVMRYSVQSIFMVFQSYWLPVYQSQTLTFLALRIWR